MCGREMSPSGKWLFNIYPCLFTSILSWWRILVIHIYIYIYMSLIPAHFHPNSQLHACDQDISPVSQAMWI